MNTHAATRFIKPDVLSRISSLEVLARGVVEGFLGGLHKSPYKGSSVEFMSYRPYMPGDDPLRVDWKLFARSDRHYIKEFEAETNAAMHILVDVSQSMSYASGEISKMDYAMFLAASLSYLMIGQRDGVGLTFFDEDILERIPPKSSKSHLHTLLSRMESQDVGEKTAFGKPLHKLAEQLNKRAFVVLISDLLDDPKDLVDGLKHFRFKGHNVIVFHLQDPQEVDFDFKDLVEFEDLETGEKVLISAEEAKKHYTDNLNKFQNTLQKECGLLGVDYQPVRTDEPLDEALFTYLAARRK